MPISRFRILLLLALVFALGSPALARKRETGFLDRTLSLPASPISIRSLCRTTGLPIRNGPLSSSSMAPANAGTDGLIDTQVGIATAIRNDRSRFPALVVMPQRLKDHRWTDGDMEELSLSALGAASREFKGNPKRTYLTGLSMGGYGSWSLAARYPNKFAAVVPICGGIIPPMTPANSSTLTAFPISKPQRKSARRSPSGSSMAMPTRPFPSPNPATWSKPSRLLALMFITPNIPAWAIIPGTKPTPSPNS